jgi:hypothetical protein
MEATMEMLLFLFLVLERSHVIALRGSYNVDCKWKKFRWSLVETWSRLSRHTSCTHPCNKREENKVRTFLQEGYLCKYKVFYMEIDSIDHSSVHQEESVEPEGPTHNRYSNQEETSMVS